MQWSEPAYVLSYRAHGERDAIVSVLAREAGRHVGLVRGGQSSKNKGGWQPGCLVNAAWRARLPEHLGTITGEVVRDYGAAVLTSPIGLAAHLAALTLLDVGTPERMPLPYVFDTLADVLPLDDDADDIARYVRFECACLSALGYGLDLSSCALTGQTHDLAFVSPRTGRAASAAAARPWAEKLLPLPAFVLQATPPSWDDVLIGLRLSGHFIEQNLLHGLPALAAQLLTQRRTRLLDLVERERHLLPAAERAAV